eukprot:GILK01007510.1.p1 GENE.GILK01007510.1~~GILK01007510.1.p1  ORF type:complete len:1556 (-),score=363.36 GILK01007510.1:252-4919(-)
MVGERFLVLCVLLLCVCPPVAALTKCKEATTCEGCAGQSEEAGFVLKSTRSCVWLQDNSQALPEGRCVREDKTKSATKTLQGTHPMQILEPARCPSRVYGKFRDCKGCIAAGCLWVEWNKPTDVSHLPQCTTRTLFAASTESRSTADLHVQQSNQDAESMCAKSALKKQMNSFYDHILISADFRQILKAPHLDEDAFGTAIEEFIETEKDRFKGADDLANRFYSELSVLFDPETASVFDQANLFEYLRKSIQSGTAFDRLESRQLQASAEPFYAYVMIVTEHWRSRMFSAVANDELQRAQRLTDLAHLAISLKRVSRDEIRKAVSPPLMSALRSRKGELSRLMIPLLKGNMGHVQENVKVIGTEERFDRTVLSAAIEIDLVEPLAPDFNIVKLLLDNGARPDHITTHGNGPLEFAYKAGEYFPTVADRIVEEFFNRAPKQLCHTDFFRFFIEYKDLSRLQQCIGLHPELLGSTKDDKKQTELINLAVENDFTAGVVWLLQEAKRLGRYVHWSKSVYAYPIRNLNRVLVELLLEEGMDVLDPSMTDYPLLLALKRFVRADPHQVETALEVVSLLSQGVDLAALHPRTRESPLDSFLKELIDVRKSIKAPDVKLKYYFKRANDDCLSFYGLLEPFHADEDSSLIRNTLTAFAHLEQIVRLNKRRHIPSVSVAAFREGMQAQPNQQDSTSNRQIRYKMAEALWWLASFANRVLFESGADLDEALITFVTTVASVPDWAYLRSILFSLSSEYDVLSSNDPQRLFTMDSLKRLQADLISLEPTSDVALQSIHDFFWDDLNRKFNGPAGFERLGTIGDFGQKLLSYASVSALPQIAAVDLMNRFNEELKRRVPGVSSVMTAIADASGLKYYLAISPKTVTVSSKPLSMEAESERGKEHAAVDQSEATVDADAQRPEPKSLKRLNGPNYNAPVLQPIMNQEALKVDPLAEKAYRKYLEGLQQFMVVDDLIHSESIHIPSTPTPAALEPAIKDRYFQLSATVFKSDRQFYVKLRQIKLLQTSIKFNSLYGVSPSTVEDRELRQQLNQLGPEPLAFVAAVDLFCELTKAKSRRCDPIKDEETRILSYLKQLGGTCREEGGPALIQSLSRTMTVVLVERFVVNGEDLGSADPRFKMASLGGYLRHLATAALVVEPKQKAHTEGSTPPPKGQKQVDERTALKNARRNERKRLQELEKSKQKKIDCKIAKSTLSQFTSAWLLSVHDDDFDFQSQTKTDASTWFDVGALSAHMMNQFITQFDVDSTYQPSDATSTLDWIGNQLSNTILDDSKWQKPELLFAYLKQRTQKPADIAVANVFKRWVRSLVGVSSETPFDIRYRDGMNLDGFKPFGDKVIQTWIDPDHKIPEMSDDPLSMFLMGEFSVGSCQRVSQDISWVNHGVMGYVVNANTKLIALDQDPQSKIFSGRAVIRLGHFKSVDSSQDEPVLILEAPYQGIYKGRATPPDQLERSILNQAKRIQAAFLKQNIHISMVIRISHYSQVVDKQMCIPASSIPDDSTIELTAALAPYIYSDFAMQRAEGPSFSVSMAEKELFCIVDRHTHAHLPEGI